jgi:hypothetical protein
MSKFTIGAIVAVMEDQTVVRQDVVTKVYKTGNFTLRDSDDHLSWNDGWNAAADAAAEDDDEGREGADE